MYILSILCEDSPAAAVVEDRVLYDLRLSLRLFRLKPQSSFLNDRLGEVMDLYVFKVDLTCQLRSIKIFSVYHENLSRLCSSLTQYSFLSFIFFEERRISVNLYISSELVDDSS